MSKVAIVITYDGAEPSDITKSHICNTLTQSGCCNCQKEVCIYFVNEKELVQAIAAKPVSDMVNQHFYKNEEHLTEQELAVTYIAGICKNSINKSVSHFAADFAVKFCDAVRKGNNPQLLEAVKILIRDYAMSRVGDKIRRETGFNDEIYQIVLNISSDTWNV